MADMVHGEEEGDDEEGDDDEEEREEADHDIDNTHDNTIDNTHDNTIDNTHDNTINTIDTITNAPAEEYQVDEEEVEELKHAMDEEEETEKLDKNVCRYCHKYGHKERKCPELHPELQKAPRMKPKKNVTELEIRARVGPEEMCYVDPKGTGPANGTRKADQPQHREESRETQGEGVNPGVHLASVCWISQLFSESPIQMNRGSHSSPFPQFMSSS